MDGNGFTDYVDFFKQKEVNTTSQTDIGMSLESGVKIIIIITIKFVK